MFSEIGNPLGLLGRQLEWLDGLEPRVSVRKAFRIIARLGLVDPVKYQ